MDAPPTPPPMTTARAWLLKRSLGGRFSGCDFRRARHPVLRERVVDGADDDDHPDGRFEDRDVAEEARDAEVGQSAQRWVARAARPQEVDEHAAAPHEAEDVDEQAPAPELERRAVLRPALRP